MAAINHQMMQMRALEQGFRLTGDKALAERLNQALATVLEGISMSSDAKASGVPMVLENIKAYGTAFGEFARLNTSRRLAMDGAAFLVSGAANSLSLLQSSLLDNGTYAMRES